METNAAVEGHASSGKLFAEPEKVSKAKLTMSMTRRHNRIVKSRNMRRNDSWAYAIAESLTFNVVIGILIGVSCVWVGYSLDNDPELAVPADEGTRTVESMTLIKLVDSILCGIFTAEQMIRIASYKKPYFYVTDPVYGSWNAVDFTVQLIMILDVWILNYVNSTETAFMRVLRITRLLRLIRGIRLVPELVILFRAILSASRAVMISIVPMISIIYTFAVIMTEWCNAPTSGRIDAFGIYFKSVGQSMLTMWQIAVFDDSFGIIRPVTFESPAWGIMLIVFMFLASFMVLNVLVGVIREVVFTTTNSYKERFLQAQLEDIYDVLDDKEDGKIVGTLLTGPCKARLLKLGIKEEVLPNLLHQMDPYETGHIPREVFVLFILRNLRAPQAQELIIALKTVTAIRGLLHAKKYQIAKDLEKTSGGDDPISLSLN
jgi:voltage-gated sodium channel